MTRQVTGVYLRNCRNPTTGTIQPWAWEYIRLLGSYTEIDPTGTGVQIFGFGFSTLPDGKTYAQKGNVEMCVLTPAESDIVIAAIEKRNGE